MSGGSVSAGGVAACITACIAILLSARRYIDGFANSTVDVDSNQQQDSTPHETVASLEWADVWKSAAEFGRLPLAPVLLRNSPMQRWWESNSQQLSIDTVAALAETSPTGDYNVTWLGQNEGPIDGLYGPKVFLNHNAERYDGYRFARGREGALPHHTRRARTLRQALRELWATDPAGSRGASYVTTFMDDSAPSLAQPLTEWLPDGCLRDDRFSEAVSWDASVADYSTFSDCRDLNAVLWLGAAGVGVSTHYDVSHNLFFQVAGTKRFTLLPCESHKALRLFPHWHGSNRQAQATPPANLRQWEVTLGPGEVLFLPSRVFHQVTSLTPSVGINSWTGGLNRDCWLYLMEDGLGDGGRIDGGDESSEDGAHGLGSRDGGLGGGRWTAACTQLTGLSILDCARDAFAALLATIGSDVAAAGPADTDADAPMRVSDDREQLSPTQLLSVRAVALLEARYMLIAHRLEAPGAPMAAAERVAAHCRSGGGPLRTWAAWKGDSALLHSALALELLSESDRDLALDDLLDHTAAWAVSQIVDGDEEVDGAAVKAFLSDCCAQQRTHGVAPTL